MQSTTSRIWLILFTLLTLLMLSTVQAKMVTVTAYSNGLNGSLGGNTGLYIDGNSNLIGSKWGRPQEGSGALWVTLVQSTNIFTSPQFAIKPNTTYTFRYYTARQTLVDPVPRLQVKINNRVVINPHDIRSHQSWVPRTAQWNSGNATMAWIQIEALRTGSAGNDFGIDNITLITQEDQAPPKKTLKVKATDSWLDTGLDIKTDDQLIITAKGKWQVDGKPETIQVDANGYGSPLSGTPLNGSFAALIGRIGNNSAPFLVGNELNRPTPGAGRLFLQINDVIGTLGDNLGELEVTIEIKR